MKIMLQAGYGKEDDSIPLQVVDAAYWEQVAMAVPSDRDCEETLSEEEADEDASSGMPPLVHTPSTTSLPCSSPPPSPHNQLSVPDRWCDHQDDTEVPGLEEYCEQQEGHESDSFHSCSASSIEY